MEIDMVNSKDFLLQCLICFQIMHLETNLSTFGSGKMSIVS